MHAQCHSEAHACPRPSYIWHYPSTSTALTTVQYKHSNKRLYHHAKLIPRVYSIICIQDMEFICIDLIGEFYPPSSKSNRYTLTAVCMLTGFTFCIPIKNKTAQEVVTAWRNHISFPFGVCRKLLTDNGTEFKKDLFSQVAEQLGVERKIYTPPYWPQSNGRIEGFHNFLKLCLAKHISRNREWDDVAPLATASYNWLPNQH